MGRLVTSTHEVLLDFCLSLCVSQNAAVQLRLQERSGRSTSRSAAWWRKSARNRKVFTEPWYSCCSTSAWRLMAASRSSPAGVSVVFEGSREDYFPELMAWAADCGASCEGFEITSFGDEGYGLRATKDIKV